MATNVTQDAILDAMVAQIAAQMVPATGEPVSASRPIRSVQRYMGAEFTSAEGLKRGITGRCPAIRVRYAGSKSLKTHVGRRVDRVESTYSVICCTDDERGKDSRKSLLPLVESIRSVVGSRAFSLSVNPMRWRQTDVLRDDEQLLAYSLTFVTRHYVDYTVDPGDEVIESASGDIKDTDDDGGATRLQVESTFQETA